MHRDPTVKAGTISRRQFAKAVASGAALAVLPDAHADAATAAETEKDQRPDGLTAGDWGEVQSRYQNLLRVYGDRLTVGEKEHAKQILIVNQRMLSSVRSFVVQNGDPSACTLRVAL